MELILSPGYKFAKQCHVVVVSLVLNTKMGKEAGEVIFYKPEWSEWELGGTLYIESSDSVFKIITFDKK